MTAMAVVEGRSAAAPRLADLTAPAQPAGIGRSWWGDFVIYVGRMREFTAADWRFYVAWVALMLGLVAGSSAFLVGGLAAGVTFPVAAYWVPVGSAIFTLSIAIDTVGHLTIYKDAIAEAEGLVHGITIFCGIGSALLLVGAAAYPDALWIPAMVLTVLSFIYSYVDEAFHWRRYVRGFADRVEMTSHVGILVGHACMMVGWWAWFFGGYQGVAETVRAAGF